MTPTKDQHAEIMRMIKDLPEMIDTKKIAQKQVSGQTLIDQGMKLTKDKKPIQPGLFYLLNVPHVVNHKSTALNLFKKGGMEEVKGYCYGVIKIFNEQTAPKPVN